MYVKCLFFPFFILFFHHCHKDLKDIKHNCLNRYFFSFNIKMHVSNVNNEKKIANHFKCFEKCIFQECSTYECCKCSSNNTTEKSWKHPLLNKGALKYFAIFKGKHLCLSLFLMKLQACNFIKKRLQQRCFLVNITKFLRTHFFTEHLQWLLLSIHEWGNRNSSMFFIESYKYMKEFYRLL